MNDGVLVEVVDSGHKAILEFLFGRDPDMAEHRTGELRKEALDEVEPGAVLGREGEFEAMRRPLGKPGSGLSRDVCGMIVEDQLDRGRGRIGRIDKLEKLNELAAAMAVAHQGMHLPTDEINPGEQADRAVALVFVVARKTRMPTGSGGRSGPVVAIA